MVADRGLIRLLTWLSPSFPTGGFAHSHGLEWAVEAGDIRDGKTLRLWLVDILRHGAGRNDAILLRHAHRAADDQGALDVIVDLAVAAAASHERQIETLTQGTAFATAARSWDEIPRAPYPVAVGALAGRQGIDESTAVAAYLQAFTANLVSAAVRLVPLGQSAGLAVLAALEPVIVELIDATEAASIDDLGGSVFRADIAAMRHETQYTRLFRT